MGTPTKQAISVAVDAVRAAAHHWEVAADALEKAKQAAEKAKFEKAEAGVFALAYDKYKDAPGFMRDRMTEGMEVCRTIAHTMRHVADTYQAEDERNEHAIRNLY
ncbi:type VII secretion target [Nocardia sp. NPDC127579]|uniref:type VII secretion target n=1 Tax=Nocardia sp. NPDC127579 TaxID=3345402 RepID=UPI00363CD546